MKTLTLRSFLVGFFFGALVFSGLFYFIRNSQHSQITRGAEIKTVDNATALALRDNYTGIYPDRLKAVNVSMLQIHAIKEVISVMKKDELQKIEGFRLFFAIESNKPAGTISSLVYPIYEMEPLNRNTQVYMVSGIKGQYSLPCPPFCDTDKSN